MYLPVEVNGIQSSAVIDRGPQVSIMSKTLYDNLVTRPQLSGTVRVKGISTTIITARMADNVNRECESKDWKTHNANELTGSRYL